MSREKGRRESGKEKTQIGKKRKRESGNQEHGKTKGGQAADLLDSWIFA